jgi:hypothetical protein
MSPMICKECKHLVMPEGATATFDEYLRGECAANSYQEYVSGKVFLKSCSSINHDGKCKKFEIKGGTNET